MRICVRPFLLICLGAAMLAWPAFYNGYPLVFADTGTYLTQALRWYAGWDRPPVYSMAIRPLHMAWSTWPIIAAQALMTAHVLYLVWRCLVQRGAGLYLAMVAVLCVGTNAPWVASQLIPDIFAPILVLAIGLLMLVPERLLRWEKIWLFALTTLAIAVHTTHLPLALGLVLALTVLQRMRPWRRMLVMLIPAVLAAGTWVGINTVAHGRVAMAPFGNVFLLARVIFDGPGLRYLQSACPEAGYRLCPYVADIRTSSDHFLWEADSPLYAAGGPKLVAEEAGRIVAASLRAEPWEELRVAARNAWTQFWRFQSGDGTEAVRENEYVSRAVSTYFPTREYAAFRASRQNTDRLDVLAYLKPVSTLVAFAGLLSMCVLGFWQRRTAVGMFCVAVLLALLGNAILTGALSGPHDRYQARLVWLGVVAAFTVLGTLRAPVYAGRHNPRPDAVTQM